MFLKQDTLNQLANIAKNSQVDRLRQHRPIVVNATQASLESLFSNEIKSISIEERVWVSIYAAHLVKQPKLVDYFLTLSNSTLSPEILHAIQDDQLNLISEPRLQQILYFTQRITLSPVNANEAHLIALQQQGLTTEAIVVLAQLIAFISYQARILSGLVALNEYVKNR